MSPNNLERFGPFIILCTVNEGGLILARLLSQKFVILVS